MGVNSFTSYYSRELCCQVTRQHRLPRRPVQLSPFAKSFSVRVAVSISEEVGTITAEFCPETSKCGFRFSFLASSFVSPTYKLVNYHLNKSAPAHSFFGVGAGPSIIERISSSKPLKSLLFSELGLFLVWEKVFCGGRKVSGEKGSWFREEF